MWWEYTEDITEGACLTGPICPIWAAGAVVAMYPGWAVPVDWVEQEPMGEEFWRV